jgi:hypothetical protein
MAATIKRKLTGLIANGYRETFARVAMAARKTIAINNNAKRVIGRTIRSRVRASRSAFHTLTAEYDSAGEFVKISVVAVALSVCADMPPPLT